MSSVHTRVAYKHAPRGRKLQGAMIQQRTLLQAQGDVGPKGGVDTDSQHCCVAHSRGRAGTEMAPVLLQCRLIVLPPAGPQVQKLYIAIVEESMRLMDKGFVGPTARQMQVPSKGRRRAEEAGLAAEEGPVLTQYIVLARCPEEFALLALQPVTGVLMQYK